VKKQAIVCITYWLGIILCAFLAQGCRSVVAIKEAGSQPSSTIMGSPASKEIVQELNLKINSHSATDNSAKKLTDMLVQKISSILLADGYKIEEKNADLLVDINANVSIFDKSGNYYRHDGEVDAKATISHTRKTVGEQHFTAKNERQLGEEKSLEQLAKELAKPVAEWVSSLAGQLGREIAANNIEIRRPVIYGKISQAEYANMFVKKVGGIDGVVSCELVSHDYEQREMVFRVVYYRKKFPAGIMNKILTMDELGLTP